MPNKLEQAAITQRNFLIAKDIYNQNWATPSNTNNQYSPTHTRALADTTTPIYGKGTGQFLDTNNYNAGGEYDIKGNTRYVGSGRNSAIAKNLSDWGYGPNVINWYKLPDTSGNLGQYHNPS